MDSRNTGRRRLSLEYRFRSEIEKGEMTTVQITLPDELAQEAQQAGLLSPQALEAWLRERLKAQHVDAFFQAADRMGAVDDTIVLSPEAVAEEIVAMRAERRARRPS